MSNDKIDIPVDLDLGPASRALNVLKKLTSPMNLFGGSLKSANTNLDKLHEGLSSAANLTNQMAKMSPESLAKLSAEDAAAAAQQIQDTQARSETMLTTLADKWGTMKGSIDSTIDSMIELQKTTTNKAAEQAIDRLRGRVDALKGSVVTPIDGPETSRPAATTAPEPSTATAASGLNAAATIAAAASAGKLNAALNGVNKVYGTVKQSVTTAADTVGVSMKKMRDYVRRTQSDFDKFRTARAAPDVDEDLNVVKTGLDKAGDAAAGLIDKVRGTADAVADGLGDSLNAAARAANKVSGALDDVAATTTKYEWKTIRARKALGLLGTVLRPLKPLTDKARTALDGATEGADRLARTKVSGALNGMQKAIAAAGAQAAQMGPDVKSAVAEVEATFERLSASVDSGELSLQDAQLQVGEMAAKLSALGMVATGTFEEGGGSAKVFGNAMYFAALPARLLKREFEGGNRIVEAYHATVSALNAPFRMVSNYFGRTRQDAKLLHKAVENKSFAWRATSKSLFYAHRALTPVVAVTKAALTPVRLLGRGAVRMGGAVKRGAKNVGGAVKNLIMFGRSSVEAGSAAANLAASTGNVTAAMIGMRNASKTAGRSVTNVFIKRPAGLIKGIVSSKLAMGALAAAALSWGAANAIATETATTQFGTLLQDMDQGKALIQEITGFSAKTPFANEALRESASLLLAAKVPADEITNRLQTLGDIASGTNKPLKDYAAIFQKVANTDKFGLEQINQLAERGVPIYSALQDTLGVTRGELMDMVSKGKLGFTEMDVALQSLTTGAGMFAGGMAAQSQTVAGLWSTLKDNVGIALESFLSVYMGGSHAILSTAIAAVQGFTSIFQRIKPVIVAMNGVVKAYAIGLFRVFKSAFGLIWGIVDNAFQMMGFSGEVTFDGIIKSLIRFYTIAQYTLENFPLAAAIAFDSTALFFIGMANDMAYFFTTKVPAWLDWFGRNWYSLFADAASFVGTFATNIVTNITSAWSAIWDYITGKSDSLNFDWTPLTEGFQSTVEELPNIPDRALSDLEKRMTSDLDAMQKKFGDGMGEAVADALKTLEPPPPVELKSTVAKTDAPEEDEQGTKQKGRTDFVVNRLERGSAEELKAIFAASNQNKTPEKQLKAQNKTNEHLAEIKEKPEFVFEFSPGVT